MEENLKILNVHKILNLDLGDQRKMFKYFKWRQPPMEDNLKISKVEYLSKNWIESFSNLISTLDDQTIIYKSFKWRWPPMEDCLKKLKVEYLSNRFLDHTQISNFCLDDQIIFCKASK